MNLQKLKKVAFWVLLPAVFAYSVHVRSENMQMPMSRHHEWISAHTLLTLKIWEKEGIANHYFSPVYAFSNPGDIGSNFLGGVVDQNNRGYYVSYPPFAFILPYVVFRVMQVPMDHHSLQWFSLAIHFCVAFTLLLIINLLSGRRLGDGLFIPSFAAYGAYLFMPGALWFHSNVYFCDTLVQMFFVLLVYLYLLMYKAQKISKWLLTSFGLCVFAAVYTEWLGLFVAFSLFICTAVLCFKNRQKYMPVAIAIALCTTLPLLTTVWQYAQISGFDNLIETSAEKYANRSGHSKADISDHGLNDSNPYSIPILKQHYETSYGPFFPLIRFSAILLALVLASQYLRKRENAADSLLLVVTGVMLPIALHHFVFYNFTVVHDFSTLKTGVPIALLLGLVVAKLQEVVSAFNKSAGLAVALSLTAYFYFVYVTKGVEKYLEVNNPKNASVYFALCGTIARKYISPDEVVFARVVSPEMLYYTERNVVKAGNLQEATAALNGHMMAKKGVFIDIENFESPTVKRLVRINAVGDSVDVKL